MKKPEAGDETGRFAYDGLDRIIHEKARLGILTSLATHAGGLRFNELKTLCSLTDGNLNRHLQPLQDAGLIEVQKDVPAAANPPCAGSRRWAAVGSWNTSTSSKAW